MTYRIRTVAEMTGIPRNTLIAWERRYRFIQPDRHENGYRSYTDDDVEKLRREAMSETAWPLPRRCCSPKPWSTTDATKRTAP